MRRLIHRYFDSFGTYEVPAESFWIFALIYFPIAFPFFALKCWIFDTKV